jgi:hypothetical protein
MPLIRFLAIVCIITASVAASAQEFDIFDRSDFLDPRLRGVAFVRDARGIMFADQAPFLLSQFSVGRVSDYYWRTAPTGADVTVTNLATSYYRGRHQLNLKLTNFATNSGSAADVATIPRHRATLQWAIYHAQADPSPPKDSDEKAPVILTRWVFSASVEEPQRLAESPTGISKSGGRNYELGGEMDIRIPGVNVVGTLSYAHRHSMSGTTQRFAYVYRTGQHGFRRLKVDTSVGYVAQKARSWRWGNIRPAVHVRIPVDRASTAIHFAYAPTISVIGGVRVRHEVAVFLDRAMIAHVFRRPAPGPEPTN